MKYAALLLLLLPLVAASQDLFSRLDRDGNGYLSREELEQGLDSGGSWIAVDRDRDERIARSEFTSMEYAERSRRQPVESQPMDREPVERISARRFIGMHALDPGGAPAGKVSDVLVDEEGRATAVDLGTRRVDWERIKLARDYIVVPEEEASAGAPRPFDPQVLEERRVSELLAGEARIEGAPTAARVADIVILPSGRVAGVQLADGAKRRYVYPWPRVEFVR